MKKHILIALALTSILASCGTGDTSNHQTQQHSSSGAASVNIAAQFHIPTNGTGNTIEQQNILDRQQITNDHTKIMWVHLVDMNGRIYLRTPVRGKLTSSGKRLEPSTVSAGMANGQGIDTYYGTLTPEGGRTTERLQIDGTYGSSDAYVFWFDPRGHYFQKGDGYIMSDMPINVKEPVDEITGLYNLDAAAKQWQDAQNKENVTK